ncbi:MAG: amino acid ABC transporter substrate-binding protein [Bacteroidota bacterium]
MISVQNHRQLLSGNKSWLIFTFGLLISACSPKIKPEVKATSQEPKKIEAKVEKPATKFTEATISLLLPFRLNSLNLKSATKADVERSAMAIDFYQGFKMGIDSATASPGLNFTLKVHDTRDNNSQIEGLMQQGKLLNSNLIVGPVFPEGLKHIRDYAVAKNILIVNPLAATHPKEFNNPKMISIVNNVDLHAEKIGNHIIKHYTPNQTVIVLINPATAENELMASPLRKFFEDPKKPFFFQEFASVFTMEMKLIKNKKYVIMLTSSDRKFVIATIDKLIKLKNAGLSVDLFGHPDWTKQSYNTDKLQALNTVVTSSYKIDYARKDVNNFIKAYRSKFHFEPGEYAFKGFDIGIYFAKLIAKHGVNYYQFLTKENHQGLQSNFVFQYDAKQGYINTSVMLLRYQNFALNSIE